MKMKSLFSLSLGITLQYSLTLYLIKQIITLLIHKAVAKIVFQVYIKGYIHLPLRVKLLRRKKKPNLKQKTKRNFHLQCLHVTLFVLTPSQDNAVLSFAFSAGSETEKAAGSGC